MPKIKQATKDGNILRTPLGDYVIGKAYIMLPGGSLVESAGFAAVGYQGSFIAVNVSEQDAWDNALRHYNQTAHSIFAADDEEESKDGEIQESEPEPMEQPPIDVQERAKQRQLEAEQEIIKKHPMTDEVEESKYKKSKTKFFA